MSYKLRELVRELEEQKKKYHEKLLSVDAELSLLDRFMYTYDLASGLSYLIIPEFYFASLSASFLFGFDLFEAEPLNLEFSWRYPTLDEWLSGVSVVFERIVPDFATTFEQFVLEAVKEEYREQFLEVRVEKAVYGKSRYDESYYDPPAVRELFRTMTALLFKKHASSATARRELRSLIEALNLNPDVAKSIYNVVSMHVGAHRSCFILGYGVLGFSFLGEAYPSRTSSSPNPGVRLGKAVFEDADGYLVEAGVAALSDLQTAFILGVSALGVSYLSDGEDIYILGEARYTRAPEAKARRFAERYTLSPMGLSNYVRGDEAADHYKCERTNTWGELTSMRYAVEAVVEGFLARELPDLNPFDRRKYVSAVLQLMGHLGKRHRWGYGFYKAMTEEELKAWWADYWKAQGLDLNILERLLDLVRPWLERITRTKVERGRRLRLQRLGLPLE